MRAFVGILFVAAVASARSLDLSSRDTDPTANEAEDPCPNNLNLMCCDKEPFQPGPEGRSLVDDVEVGLDLLKHCSQLSVSNLVADIQYLATAECPRGKVACCQESPSNAGGSLIIEAIPCISLANLAG